MRLALAQVCAIPRLNSGTKLFCNWARQINVSAKSAPCLFPNFIFDPLIDDNRLRAA